MLAPRLLFASLGLGGAACLTASCTSVLGLNEENRDVAQEACICFETEGLFTAPEVCQATLSARLEGAPPHERAAWMELFSKYCAKGCSTECAMQLSKAPPACTAGGEECLRKTDCQDCCNGESATLPGSCAEKL